MRHKNILDSSESIRLLGELLSVVPEVAKLDRQNHQEAWALVHMLRDLEKEFCDFLDLLPELLEGKGSKPKLATLLDIGESFRHIDYHLRASRFYEYLQHDVETRP